MANLIHHLLRALVRLLPAEFRYDFGAAIRDDFTHRQDTGDRAGLLRRDLPSLLIAVIREHTSAIRLDVGYALRTMRRTPGFTATAVLMLALGTGVNVAMFSVLDTVMLKSPFRQPDRLVEVGFYQKKAAVKDWRTGAAALTPERFSNLVASSHAFISVSAYTPDRLILTSRGEPRSLPIECVSASMFDVLGTPPLFGRTFGSADDRPGAPATIVLGFDLWQELGGSPSLIGTTLTLNQTPVTVVGVMPRGFAGPYSRPRSRVDAWTPLGRPISGNGETSCTSSFLNAFGRLRDGLTVDAANAQLQDYVVVSLHDQTFERVEAPLWSLSAAVACVLLIACFNVGGLQMERMLGRRREMALRMALGASRARLVRQTLTENLVLSLTGAAAGLATTWFSMRTIVALLPSSLPHLNEIALNVRVLTAALAAAATAGMIAGLIPIGQTRRLNPAADLTAGTRSSEHRGSWTRRTLVVVEIALSVVVLIGAGLMIQTFLTLRPTTPGFDPARKTIGFVRLPNATPEAGQAFALALVDRLRTAPGVRDVAIATNYPMRGATASQAFTLGATTALINTYRVTPGYFEMMRIPVRAGRTFNAADSHEAIPVVVVNEAFAERLRPGGQVVGDWIAVKPSRQSSDPPIQRQIVGVMANTRFQSWHTRTEAEAFVPLAQNPSTTFYAIVESDGRADSVVVAELGRAIRALEPDLVIDSPKSMATLLESGAEQWRFGAWLLGVFAALAVLLAAIGLTATIGWWVRQRTHELGVRLALGATRWEITRLVCRQGFSLATLGIVIGCAVAAGTTRYLQGWIYGVTPLDPTTFAACAATMMFVGAAAVWVPVRHATAVDPAIALRAE